MWNDNEVDLIRDWDQIDWQTACLWHYSINKRCLPDDQTSNYWALLLL
jgi:hypothetical protein